MRLSCRVNCRKLSGVGSGTVRTRIITGTLGLSLSPGDCFFSIWLGGQVFFLVCFSLPFLGEEILDYLAHDPIFRVLVVAERICKSRDR